ncbi:hypothetical protein PUN28_000891 [Cardiocondyla obscurior]|uniref:Uncharacterized protein n=1 Tax=Cardiocondyla obscurior TaxID=286306 RepID=A0AAW2H202_9HYME
MSTEAEHTFPSACRYARPRRYLNADLSGVCGESRKLIIFLFKFFFPHSENYYRRVAIIFGIYNKFKAFISDLLMETVVTDRYNHLTHRFILTEPRDARIIPDLSSDYITRLAYDLIAILSYVTVYNKAADLESLL